MVERGSGSAAMSEQDSIAAKWEHIAHALLQQVYGAVNLPEFIGTGDETGCLILFFNADHHEGKSTLVSTENDRSGIEKLLRGALHAIKRGKGVKVIEPEKAQ